MEYAIGMMSEFAITDILKLSVAERIQLVGDIWDSVAEAPESIPLTDAEKLELDRRLDAYHRNPTEGTPWEVVRERIRHRS